ncbi:glycine-rich RNA-binding protein 4, mitochondrial-like [Rhodamnia argentea]|uniref:Glycine-rich RNA-binding protein 4, mitochondrial-like n=1 Tax=Rhodamnia argentea TaxID=178133 RepID=A0ABM3HZE1_9MYRT|nr:glycine-rich RNA-binding protein 4, mitochondrial-like [Rhodamnia argentea]
MDRTRALTAQNPNQTFSLRRFCSPPMSCSSPSNSKLFVGGMSWSVDEKSLKDAFSSFGEVTEVKILNDKAIGRSSGFGFVCFTNQPEATSAKDAIDGKALLGQPLRISYALEKVRDAPVVVHRLSSIGNGTSLKQ